MTDRPQRDFDDLLIDGAATAPTGGHDVVADDPIDARVAAAEPDARGSRLDDWFGRVVGTPTRLRIWQWGVPIAVTILAAVLRLWNLGHPHSLVFDETFYVKDAYTLSQLGFEGAWPENPDPGFAAGDTEAFTGAPSFVAHPPLGKWLIALGIQAFGVDSSFGWRFSTAVAGIVGVVVVMLIARMLFRSALVAAVAGLLMAIDGHAITLARVSLLDNFLMILTLLGVGAVLLDRQWSSARFAERQAAGAKAGQTEIGPILWWRPWLLTAGVLFGLASGVKWTGVYFLAAFGVYVVVVDLLQRRRAGLPAWVRGGVLHQGVASFLVLVPVAVVSYLATWTGWLVTSGGYYRNWATESAENAWTGVLSWVPHWAQNLWHYHAAMYNYSINLRATHPYEANPLTWLFMTRPTSMYYVGSADGQNGCTFTNCSEAITSLANPLIWWVGAAALFYLLYRLVRFREWKAGFVLMGIVAGYLPWMLYLDRTVFQFYGIVYLPYMILALAYTASILLGSRADPRPRRVRGIRVVAVFVVASIIISAFFWPIWVGLQIPYSFWQAHMWLPSWI